MKDNEYDDYYKARHETITAQESAVRERVRAEKRERLRAAQAKANEIRAYSERQGKSKYHNRKSMRMIDGKPVQFDSVKEAGRWDELFLLQRAGKISDLKRQVRYRLIPEQRDARGRVIERPCDYYADFVYTQDGRTVVEDAKGHRTAEYIIKRKLMLRVYGIRIREV